MREYLLVLLVAAAVTFLASGVCRRIALRTGALAQVRDRDVHTVAMPYFGGVAMFFGVLAAIVLAWQLPFLGRQVLVQQDSLAVLIAAAVICAVGVLDDLYDLSALTKFAGQVLAAGIVVALGVRMLWIPLPGQLVSLDFGASVAITVFFIVLCSNAVNFVDGLDGLATGVVGIGACAFFAYSYVLIVTQDLTRATTSSLITVAIAGACLGFLPHNFFPARMFMGDSGAMLLGLLLATSTISLTGQLDPSQLDRRPGRADAAGAAPGAAAGDPGAALPGPDDGLHPAHLRRSLVVPAGQAAPAPPAARARPQPAARRAADVRLVGAGLVRRDRARAWSRPIDSGRWSRWCC